MRKKVFDYSKLRGRIKEKYNTQDEFASAIGLGRVSLSKRLNNQLDFSQGEIKTAAVALGIEASEIPAYFFTLKV